MKALIFNGTTDTRADSTAGILVGYLESRLKEKGITAVQFNLAESGIPLFDYSLSRTPKGVEVMNSLFQEADLHFWVSPLYHGSIPGIMKNCLDWLELTARNPRPYLTDKVIGMVCWADGVQAMQGINAMEAIAKSLRAWPIPYSVPLQRSLLLEPGGNPELAATVRAKLDLLVSIGTSRKIQRIP